MNISSAIVANPGSLVGRERRRGARIRFRPVAEVLSARTLLSQVVPSAPTGGVGTSVVFSSDPSPSASGGSADGSGKIEVVDQTNVELDTGSPRSQSS